MRALKKMAGISAKENAKVLEHLSEGKELRESNAELYQYDEDDYSSDSLDDQLDQ